MRTRRSRAQRDALPGSFFGSTIAYGSIIVHFSLNSCVRVSGFDPQRMTNETQFDICFR